MTTLLDSTFSTTRDGWTKATGGTKFTLAHTASEGGTLQVDVNARGTMSARSPWREIPAGATELTVSVAARRVSGRSVTVRPEIDFGGTIVPTEPDTVLSITPGTITRKVAVPAGSTRFRVRLRIVL